MKEEGVSIIASLEYCYATKEIKKACRKVKKPHLLQKCDSIEEHCKVGNNKAMYDGMKNLTRRFKPSLNVIKNKDGRRLTEDGDVLGRRKEYCNALYDDEALEKEAGESLLLD